jgi:hypothetical protein
LLPISRTTRMTDTSDSTTESTSTEQSTDQYTWATWHEALRLLRQPRHLKSALRVALVVGTVLFLINQLDVVLSGRANAGTILKIALTFCVPFAVCSYGILSATRRRS